MFGRCKIKQVDIPSHRWDHFQIKLLGFSGPQTHGLRITSRR
ncbi:hypothetical protein [Salinibacter phage 8_2]